MDYSAPTSRDLADVRSLNYALLKAMRDPGGAGLRELLLPSCRPMLTALTDVQVRRLATTPFLLCSLHEQDDAYWQRLLDEDRHPDLFAVNDHDPGERSRIVAAATGLAWQLARRDAYIARLVCGASVAWCRRLASRPLIEVLARVADRANLLVPRASGNERLWRRLLEAGVSANQNVRNAAQLAALQMILTGLDSPDQQRLKSVACRAAVPTIGM